MNVPAQESSSVFGVFLGDTWQQRVTQAISGEDVCRGLEACSGLDVMLSAEDRRRIKIEAKNDRKNDLKN